MNERPLVEELGGGADSPYRRYLRIFVGRPSLAAFVRYELITGLLGPMPGAAGFFLRSRCYPWLLQSMGIGTAIGRSVTLRSPGRIALGRRVMVDDCATLDAKGERSSIRLGDDILVGRHTILSCNDSAIRMGDFISIGPFCFFASKSVIEVGSHTSIGAGSLFMAGSHESADPDAPVIMQARTSKGIIIGENGWIGSGVTVLDGVTIGQNSIIGAGAVVSRDVPAWTVSMGNPARVIEKRK